MIVDAASIIQRATIFREQFLTNAWPRMRQLLALKHASREEIFNDDVRSMVEYAYLNGAVEALAGFKVQSPLAHRISQAPDRTECLEDVLIEIGVLPPLATPRPPKPRPIQ